MLTTFVENQIDYITKDMINISESLQHNLFRTNIHVTIYLQQRRRKVEKSGGSRFYDMHVSIHKICVRSQAFIQDFGPAGFPLYPRRVSSDLDPSSSQGVWRSAVSSPSGV